ncbi:MAG: hypothetical protein NTV70_00070 [Acidobacteria bacterium]|nr:hypothetical protein [Acidobacteriota bacterium]
MRLLLLCAALPLLGQGLDDWTRVKGLAAGREVEIYLAAKTKLKGPLVSVDDQSITLAGKSIPKADVRKVRVRSAGGRGLNAAKGAAIGAGVLAGLVLVALLFTNGSDGGEVLGASSVGGATWGAFIGVFFAGHTTVYQAAP